MGTYIREITNNKMGKNVSEEFLDDLEEKYPGIVDFEGEVPSIEDILAMFDENGNMMDVKDVEDKLDIPLRELEEEYGDEVPEVLPTIEEILAGYDDNGNKIDTKVLDIEENINVKRKRMRKRLGRRGGRNNSEKKETTDVKILQNNCDGYTSKKVTKYDS